MGYNESPAVIEQESENQLLDRVEKLEAQVESHESLKEQLQKLETHVSKLMLRKPSSGPLMFESLSSVKTLNELGTELQDAVLLEKKLKRSENQNQVANVRQTSTSPKHSEIPERDCQTETQRSKTKMGKNSAIRNPFISSEHKIETVKTPREYEQLKVKFQEERKKSCFLQQELENSMSECNVLRNKLKQMQDEQNEMKQCHLALLKKAISNSSFHKKNLQTLTSYVRNESPELQGKLTIQHFIQCGDSTMTQILIDAGDDVNSTDHAGFTPLHDVAGGGYVEMAEILLDSGADMHARATGGITPLHQAAMYGHLGMCQLLIAKGCPVDQTSDFKSTPLHFAAENGHLEVVKFLVECGAIVNAEDSSGVTPFEEATRAGHIAVAMWLAQNFSSDDQKVCFCGQPFN